MALHNGYYFYSNCRKIDLNGLVGYIGAYIGLFLGYSILQIPDLILLLSRKAKKIVGGIPASKTNSLPSTTKLYFQDNVSKSAPLETSKINIRHSCEQTQTQLQSQLEQISQKVNEFSQEICLQVEVLKLKIEALN